MVERIQVTLARLARGLAARKGWLTKDDVINTLTLAQVQNWLKKQRV